MIEQLICRVFATRNQAHLKHWSSQSYSEHSALGYFYDSVIDLIDKLVEAYQGVLDLVGDVKLEDCAKGDILTILKKDLIWINKNRSEISNKLTPLENIVDEISALYMSTIYKLENLK